MSHGWFDSRWMLGGFFGLVCHIYGIHLKGGQSGSVVATVASGQRTPEFKPRRQ